MKGEWSLDELGICRDTVIIEMEGGVLKEVHNTPNDYVLFDWDNIPQEACDLDVEVDNYIQDKKGELLLMLETLDFNAQQAPIIQALTAVSDGSTASYYELPQGAKELQDLISYKDMNAQIGEIFRATYRYGQSSHSDKLRDAKKIRFYIDAEIKRLGG